MSKKVVTILAVVGLVAVLAAPVQAQFRPRLKADIPFEFAAGRQTMPAGEYFVSEGTIPGVVVIQSVDSQAASGVLSQPVLANAIQDQARLVFHKYGNQYFLAQIWSGGDSLGRELPKSRAERELIKSAANRETTVILAKR